MISAQNRTGTDRSGPSHAPLYICQCHGLAASVHVLGPIVLAVHEIILQIVIPRCHLIHVILGPIRPIWPAVLIRNLVWVDFWGGGGKFNVKI